MKIIVSTLLIIIVFGFGISFSQEDSTVASFETQHLFSVSSGISLHTLRDEMMSPLMYSCLLYTSMLVRILKKMRISQTLD